MPEPKSWDDRATGETLAAQSVRSGAWLLARRASSNVIRLAALAVLSRHVSPSEFGLVAFAQVLLQFMTLGGETGVGVYVIQDRETDWKRRANQAFWLNLVFTAILLTVSMVAVRPVARWLGQADTVAILAGLGFAFFVRQLSTVPDALVRRNLDFRSLVIRDTISDLLTSTASVGLALSGWGVWSLVFPVMLSEPIRLAMIVKISRWRPSRPTGFDSWRTISRFSWHSAVAQVLTLITNDTDTLLIGRFFGAAALGTYNMAWQLSNIVGRNLSTAVTSVSTSSLSVLKDSVPRLRAAYVRTLSLLASLGFPVLVVMFVCADDLIATVYGPKWQASVPFLRWFIVFALVRIISSPAGALCSVMSRPDLNSRFAAGFVPFYLAAIAVGSRQGLLGVCIAVVCVRSVGAVVWLYWSGRLIGLTGGGIVESLRRPLLSSLIVAVSGGFLVTLIRPLSAVPAVRLLLTGVLLLPVYLLAILVVDRRGARELADALKSLLPSRNPRRARAAATFARTS